MQLGGRFIVALVNGDGNDDLAIAVNNAPVRLMQNRGGEKRD
jgi:hypothetical protein